MCVKHYNVDLSSWYEFWFAIICIDMNVISALSSKGSMEFILKSILREETSTSSSTPRINYRKTSSISRTLVSNKIVDNSDVVGASPVGAAPTTSSFST